MHAVASMDIPHMGPKLVKNDAKNGIVNRIPDKSSTPVVSDLPRRSAFSMAAQEHGAFLVSRRMLPCKYVPLLVILFSQQICGSEARTR